jgi:hypothetical protein
MLRRNSATRVTYRHHNFIRLATFHRKLNASVPLCRVDRIANEVIEYLSQFGGMNRDLAFRHVMSLHFNAGSHKLRLKHRARVVKD